jgi:hypothetical protein
VDRQLKDRDGRESEDFEIVFRGLLRAGKSSIECRRKKNPQVDLGVRKNGTLEDQLGHQGEPDSNRAGPPMPGLKS